MFGVPVHSAAATNDARRKPIGKSHKQLVNRVTAHTYARAVKPVLVGKGRVVNIIAQIAEFVVDVEPVLRVALRNYNKAFAYVFVALVLPVQKSYSRFDKR